MLDALQLLEGQHVAGRVDGGQLAGRGLGQQLGGEPLGQLVGGGTQGRGHHMTTIWGTNFNFIIQDFFLENAHAFSID